MCNRAPSHIPGNCPPPPDLGDLKISEEEKEKFISEIRKDDAVLRFLLAPTPARAQEELTKLDPFCPRHGRRSRPVEIPGLRCDCPPESP